MALPRSRRQIYSDETREALLTTARDLFRERGYTKTALADVASAAQVTRGAVYHHFKDKQALYAAVLERIETDSMNTVRDAYLAHEDPVAGAFAAIAAYLDHGLDPEYAQLVLHEGPIALGWEAWNATQSEYVAGMIGQILTRLVSSGRVAPLPVETLSTITFNALVGCVSTIAAAPEADRERVRDECGEVLVHLLSGLVV